MKNKKFLDVSNGHDRLLELVKDNNDYMMLSRRKLKLNNRNKESYKYSETEFLKNQKNLSLKKQYFEKKVNEFSKIYTNNKKVFKINSEEKFKDLIGQYENKHYRIPYLFGKKNIFEPSPLLLKGKNLRNFYLFRQRNRSDSKENSKISSINKDENKTLNFLNKEQLIVDKEKYLRKPIKDEENTKNNNESIDSINFDLEEKKLNDLNNKKLNKFLKSNLTENTINSVKNDSSSKFLSYIDKEFFDNENKNDSSSEKNHKLFCNTITNNYQNYNHKFKLNEKKKNFNTLSIFSDKNSITSDKNSDPLKSIYPTQFIPDNKKRMSLPMLTEKENTISKNIDYDQKRKSFLSTRHSFFSKNIKKNKRRNSFKHLIRLFDNDDKLNQQNNKWKKVIFRNKIAVKDTFNKIINEENQTKFLEMLFSLSPDYFNKKEYEELMKVYCSKFLDYNDEKLVDILKYKNYEIQIFNLLDYFIYGDFRANSTNFSRDPNHTPEEIKKRALSLKKILMSKKTQLEIE